MTIAIYPPPAFMQELFSTSEANKDSDFLFAFISHIEKQNGSEETTQAQKTLNSIALTHLESALGAIEDREKRHD